MWAFGELPMKFFTCCNADDDFDNVFEIFSGEICLSTIKLLCNSSIFKLSILSKAILYKLFFFSNVISSKPSVNFIESLLKYSAFPSFHLLHH